MPDASVLRARACLLSTEEETRTLRAPAPAWRPPGLDRHGLRHEHLARYPCLDLSASSRALPGEAAPEEASCRSPREGLELESMKMGRTGPSLEPRRKPQAGKSGDPRSQNPDNIQ